MQRQMLKSKIHRATVTACDPEYVGVTCALEGEPGSGKVPVNGAAARLVRSGGEVSS